CGAKHRAPRKECEVPSGAGRRLGIHQGGRSGRLRAALRIAGQPNRLSQDTDTDPQGRFARYAQCTWTGAREKSEILPSFNERVLWRPGSFAAAGKLLGPRESDRAARRL